MYEELEYEFAEFKKDIDEGSLSFGRYFDEDDYEDEYSHNEIYEKEFLPLFKCIDYFYYISFEICCGCV